MIKEKKTEGFDKHVEGPEPFWECGNAVENWPGNSWIFEEEKY